ncbi:MAG TPA: hypothetical protein VNI52_00360 [Sphingobacteriaceae bacterium]|nr:hypothetical protein [Sphingobacteriaceae bacterium]
MRVLFAPTLTSFSDQSQMRMRKMINALKVPGNTIGILNSEDHNIKNQQGVIYLNAISEINEADWDIILVQNNLNLRRVGRQVRKKPILFISDNSRKKDQIINLPNLYQVISTGKDADASNRGISSELMVCLNIPVYKPSKISYTNSAENKQYTLVYFVNENDENLKTSRAVIKAVNYIPYSTLTVVTSRENIAILKEVANHNITFLSDKGSPGKHFSKYDVVVANEEVAVAALLSKKPVIIVGINGLGGLVCSDNLNDFMRTGFKGRIGGTHDEDIPVGLLDYEIRYAVGIEEEKNTPFIDETGYIALKSYYGNAWRKRFMQVLNTNLCMYQYLTNKKMLIKLIPGLSENIFLQHLKENSEVAIINKLSGKLVGSIGKEEALIINSCNRLLTIEAIIEKHKEYPAKDIIDFIVQLWQNKVLMLRLP